MWGDEGGAARGRRSTATLLLATAVALGLTACDPGDDPTTDPPTTTQTSTEPTTTEPSSDVPTPPELDPPTPPEAMGIDNREGAAAAVEHFFALVHFARTTGDTRSLEALSSPGCISCGSLIELVRERADDGGWIDAAPFELSDIGVAFPSEDETAYAVVLILGEPAGVAYNGDGSQEEIPSMSYPDVVVLAEWDGSGFMIKEVDLDAEG